MSEGLSADAKPSDSFATIPDVPVQSDATRVSPNQVASGVSRGTQTIVGSDSSKVTFGVVGSTSQLAVAQYDATSKIVSQFGQQSDGSSGLKFFDANGVGIAQFGRYADGSIAVKVAKTGVEVGSATNDQLIFNSSQDVLKVVDTKNISATVTGGNQFVTSTVAHGLTFVPAILAYIQTPVSLTGANPATDHSNPAMVYGTVAGVFRTFALCEVTVDSTNLTMAIQTDTSVGGGSYTFTAKVYLLQETFS